ncbi:MAG TPA: VWA domain-containing protein [Terriglobales bacterium]|nr:VWA domain-containing protein [Terriglobales bacterium]
MAPPRSGFSAALAIGLALVAGSFALAQQTSPKQVRPAPPQVPIIRASTTLVEVPVLVLNKRGEPIDTLDKTNFNLYDDGRLQKISSFDNQPRPLSLAIVVDTSDYDAIDQAKRSAELITAMVIGAQGKASIFIPGPEPRQLLPFTGDTNKISDLLRHLAKSPTAPQGEGSITEPLNLAMLDLQHQPRQDTRAALVISRASTKGGEQAQAIIDSGMSDAIPIFHISPNRPKNAPAHINPDSTAERGTGQGSQRVIAPPSPVDARGQPTSTAGMGNLDLAPIIGAVSGLAGKVLAPHHLDYVYNSGGVSYSAGNDSDFDQKLSRIGDDLRAIYHLYYTPNDLTRQAELHDIDVRLDLPITAGIGTTSFRRTYLGIAPH